MTHTDSVKQNQIHKSLIPMLRTWTLSIGWTVLLSANSRVPVVWRITQDDQDCPMLLDVL
jgi:hypothetical protein